MVMNLSLICRIYWAFGVLAEKEANKEAVQGPGLPGFIEDKSEYVTEDCVRWEG